MAFVLIISKIIYLKREGKMFRMSFKSLLEEPKDIIWGLIEISHAHLLLGSRNISVDKSKSIIFISRAYIFLSKSTKEWHNRVNKIDSVLPTQIYNVIQATPTSELFVLTSDAFISCVNQSLYRNFLRYCF